MIISLVRTSVCCLLVTALATAQNSARAVTPIDKTLCREPDLAHMDADLNRLYSELRPQLTVRARGELLAQQRAWLAERNRECASGDAGCLWTQYGERIDQLQALTAAAEVSEGKLDTLATVIVKGMWKATAVQDPGGGGHTNEADVRQSLSDAELPAVGSVVTAAPGKLCVPGLECRTMAWTRRTLAKLDGGDFIGRLLGVSVTSNVLIGDNGAKESPGYRVIARSDGTIWAMFDLCGPRVSNCHYATEVWTPASADAAILLRP